MGDHLERKVRLHELISKQNTGSVEHIARRLRVSRRTVFMYLSEFKDLGAQIRFSRKNNTYYYMSDFQLDKFMG